MNDHQLALLDLLIERGGFIEFHHGDCIGADTQFHKLLVGIFQEDAEKYIHIHPSNAPPLERNKTMVDLCGTLIACPHWDDELNKLRSGTWSTVRYAKKKGREIIIIL